MNNKEFDQFLRSEVDSINFDGGEQAWEQFTAAKLDQQIKSEVESIQYPDGEMAWRQFSGQDNGEGSSRRRFAYWRPFVAAASLMILVGVLLNHSSNEGSNNLNTTQIATAPEQMEDDKVNLKPVLSNQTPKTTEVVSENLQQSNGIDSPQELMQVEQQIVTLEQNTFAAAQLHNDVAKTPVNRKDDIIEILEPRSLNILESTPIIAAVNNKTATIAHQKSSNNTDINTSVASMNLLPSIGLSELEPSIAFTSVDKQLDIQPFNKRRFNLFGEIGIGNRQSGLRLVTGVSVPMNSWSVEAGIGLMNKSNRPMFFSQELESDVFPDYEEFHDYTFIQKISMIAPLRIKKRIWNRHNIIVGAQGSYNFNNQVDIESVVPNVTPQFGPGTSTGVFTSEIDYGREVYRYNNIGSAANAYSVVTSRRLNLDVIAGYELDLSRVSIGVTMAKPVFSSFSITDGIDGPVLFNILENPNVSLSLKYTFI